MSSIFSVFNNFPNPVRVSDAQGLCCYFNAAWSAFSGRRAEDEVGQSWTAGIHPADCDRCVAIYLRHEEAGEPFIMEYRLRHHTGEYRWIRELGAPQQAENGSFSGFVRSCQDIHEERNAGEQQKLYEAIFQASPMGLIITDAKGAILSVNAAFERLTGYSAADAIGNTPRILNSGKTPAEYYKQLWACILSGRTWSGELVDRRKDGSHFHARHVIAPVLGDNGEITHFFAIHEDLTELRAAEERLRHSQKLEALGQLTSGVAHDFNNFITVVLGNCELLAADLADDPVHFKMADMSRQAAARAAGLTRSLLEFSRPRQLEPCVFGLNELVCNMEEMLVGSLGRAIKVELACEADLPSVFADPGECETALLNLVVNARDAMPEGGKLTIRTALETRKPGRGEADPKQRYVVALSVCDTGTGMPPEVLQSAFDPFFTTKPPGKGTGLGLAMVYGFAQQSGGAVEAASDVGMGTTITLRLPVAEGAVVA